MWPACARGVDIAQLISFLTVQHYFYNRSMDYWHNLAIVSGQYRSIHAKLQKGEIIVRDSLHRLVYVCKMCRNPGHTSLVHSAMSQWSGDRGLETS